jgi:hypothetical protein
MVPYENWHIRTLYVAKQGLPRAYAPASKHFCMRVCKLAKTSCNVTSVTAATSIHIASSRASIVRGLLLYTRSFNEPHKKKSGGVRSGDLGDHRCIEPIRTPKWLSMSLMLALDVWHVVPSCWKKASIAASFVHVSFHRRLYKNEEFIEECLGYVARESHCILNATGEF